MSIQEELRLRQQKEVARLQEELQDYIATGNEYYADMVRQEILVASSLARLIHKADSIPLIHDYEEIG